MIERVRRAATSSMPVEVERGRRDDLQVVVGVEPARAHADAVEHLEQPVDLLDPGDPAQRRAAAVEQRRRTAARRRRSWRSSRRSSRAESWRPVTRRCVGPWPMLTSGRVERLADAGEHLEGEVLVALLDPVHRALAGAEHLGQLLLRPAPVLAGVADQVADPAEIVLESRAGTYLRYEIEPTTARGRCCVPHAGSAGGAGDRPRGGAASSARRATRRASSRSAARCRRPRSPVTGAGPRWPGWAASCQRPPSGTRARRGARRGRGRAARPAPVRRRSGST